MLRRKGSLEGVGALFTCVFKGGEVREVKVGWCRVVRCAYTGRKVNLVRVFGMLG